jgi:hypothetical protein
MLFTVPTTGGFYRKPYSTLRKNEGRKPDKNSRLRRLEFIP